MHRHSGMSVKARLTEQTTCAHIGRDIGHGCPDIALLWGLDMRIHGLGVTTTVPGMCTNGERWVTFISLANVYSTANVGQRLYP